MAGNEQIFSREALDKLRSPENLSTMIKVTNPVGWIGLAALGVAFFSILLWSVFGAFTDQVQGMGMLVDTGGIGVVTPISAGKIEKIYVYEGERIKKNQLVARISQPAQAEDTRLAQYDVNLATNERETMARVSQFDAKKHQERISQEIYSDFDGIVTEVAVAEGSMVSAGSTVCRVRKSEDEGELTGIFYVSMTGANRLKPGMTLQLALNSTKSEAQQKDSLIGVVESVGEYPASLESMKTRLGNEQVAQWFMTSLQGAVVETRFSLVPDEGNPSGYLWTSVVSEHQEIKPGSYCTGFAVVDRKPPIEKVFYKVSRWLRSR